MPKSVIIYSTTTCPYCKMAKQYMKDKNVAFTEINVQEDPTKAEEMIQKSGQMGVPVMDIDGKIIVGFDQPALKEALGIKD
jgi:glutaredoxin-like YruB-family protein